MPLAPFAAVQIDWAKVGRMLAAHIQTAVGAVDALDGDSLTPRFFMRGEPGPDENTRVYVRLVAIDPSPVESQQISGHAHHALATVALTCAVRERDGAADYLLLERLVSPVCKALRGPAITEGDTLIEFIDEPEIQDDGEPDPLTMHRSAGVTVSARVRRAPGENQDDFEVPQPSAE
jgi:hypothetical protein